jgi:hypothetical protein
MKIKVKVKNYYTNKFMLLILKDLKNYLGTFEVPRLIFLEFNPPLWQRGERGDLLNKKIVTICT